MQSRWQQSDENEWKRSAEKTAAKMSLGTGEIGLETV